jgi:hypothetical protein
MARKDQIAGLAVASEERIEACILYIEGPQETEIVFLRAFVDEGGCRLAHLLSRLGTRTCRFTKVHSAEMSRECMETLGFRSVGVHRLYSGRAQAA